MHKPKIVVIVGPTGSGKTALAIELAKEFNGEVISADSRQVYKRLDIGTEKLTNEDMQGISHHLIDIAEAATDVYTAVDFKRDAAAAITDITARGKLSIIAGGTFFYIDTLLGRITLPEVPPNETLRAELETKSTDELFLQLQSLDTTRAETIDAQNPRRLMRAIEVATALGRVPESKTEECLYDVLMIGIEVDREKLRERLRARAENAIDRGLVTETIAVLHDEKIWRHAYLRNLTPPNIKLASTVTKERLSEIGLQYREVIWYLETNQTHQNLIDRLEQVNWQYAKQQLTWLKKDNAIEWFKAGDGSAVARRVREFLG